MADAAAKTDGSKKKNPMADSRNYENVCKTEAEAPHKWNETWGQLFFKGVPFEYKERIAYLEKELAKVGGAQVPPKYGTGEKFRDATLSDFRRKKMFRDPEEDD